VKYQNSIPYGSKDIAQVKVFSKLGQSSRSRSQGQKVLVPKERSLHKVSICEISEPYPYGSKDIPQVKVFVTPTLTPTPGS
jgi:hypothetical protein